MRAQHRCQALVPNESLENLQKVHEARKPIALIESPENTKK